MSGTVNLTKGANVDLTKEAGGSLDSVMVALGWDERTTSGFDFDLDASAFVVGANGKVMDETWFVFYGSAKNSDGKPASPGNVVVHHGDNLTGAGDGDDEVIDVNLASLPTWAERVVVAVTIHLAVQRGQKFGDVRNAFVRIVDNATGAELAKYELDDEFALETAVIFGELYRKDSSWKFRAVGQGYTNGLKGLCEDHGMTVTGG